LHPCSEQSEEQREGEANKKKMAIAAEGEEVRCLRSRREEREREGKEKGNKDREYTERQGRERSTR
jgi:hypothetical protein